MRATKMAKIISLTDKKIQTLKISENKKEQWIKDQNNLYIVLKPSGRKFFIFKYTHPQTRKSRTVTFGEFPYLSLLDARVKANEHFSLLVQNIDPKDYFAQQQQEAEAKRITFADVVPQWAAWKLAKKKCNQQTMNDTLKRIENYIYPRFQGYKLDQFSKKDTLDKLHEIKSDEMRSRVFRALRQVLDYAVKFELLPFNPVSVLNDEFIAPPHKHHPTISPEELPEFMRTVYFSNCHYQTKLLIEFQLVTMLRAFEVAAIEWADVDWKSNTITIPAERMKGRKESHTFPLSSQALQILAELKMLNGHHKHVFAGRVDRFGCYSSQTANNAIKRMAGGKYKGLLTSHGMRSIASTYLNELFTEEPHVIEACLSHKDKNEVRMAYFRGNYLERRREIMQAWGDYVELCKKA